MLPALREIAAALGSIADHHAARLPLFVRRISCGPVLYGVSVGSAAWLFSHPGQWSRLAINRPSLGAVQQILACVACAAALFVGISLVMSNRRGCSTLDAFARLARAGVPALGLPFLGGLALPGIELQRPALSLGFAAIVASLFGIGTYAWANRPRGGERPWARWATGASLTTLWAGFAWFFSRLAINNHHALHTRALDLGVYDNILFQSSHGHPLACSLVRGGMHSSAHFDPILILISPLYWIHPRAEFLLVFQALWLGSGVVPAYLIGRSQLESRGAGIVLALAYVLFPALHGAALYDFHSLALIGPLVLWMLHCLQLGRLRAYAAFLVLTLMCREDAALLLCFVGFGALVDGRAGWVRAGWATLAVSLLYFVLVNLWFMRSSDFFNDGPDSYGYAFYFDALVPNNRGIRDVVSSVLTNPAFVVSSVLTPPKWLFFVLMFMPLGFLPFFAKAGRIMMLYGAIFWFLASEEALFSVHFYYASVLWPVAFAFAPNGLQRVSQSKIMSLWGVEEHRLKKAILATCVVASALVSWKFGAIVENQSFRGATGPIVRTLSPTEEETYAWLTSAIAQVPVEASLGVSARVGAHATNRPSVSFYLQGPVQDYVLIDEKELRANKRPRHDALMADGTLVEVTRHGTLVLFRRS